MILFRKIDICVPSDYSLWLVGGACVGAVEVEVLSLLLFSDECD